MILEEYFLFHILMGHIMGAKSTLKIGLVVRKKTVPAIDH
jgi:hypothetical protein